MLHILPIEPKWNWNIYEAIERASQMTSNRTKVELKLVSFTGKVFCYIFQSNQSGIETPYPCILVRIATASNRTKVELKPGVQINL